MYEFWNRTTKTGIWTSIHDEFLHNEVKGRWRCSLTKIATKEGQQNLQAGSTTLTLSISRESIGSLLILHAKFWIDLHKYRTNQWNWWARGNWNWNQGNKSSPIRFIFSCGRTNQKNRRGRRNSSNETLTTSMVLIQWSWRIEIVAETAARLTWLIWKIFRW
jgi:hypothetical protein